MITARAVDRHVEQLFDVLRRLHAALTSANIPYRVVGGLGVFLQVSAKDPLAARLTRDVHIAIGRKDLARVAAAAQPFGFRYRHAAGVDLLVDTKEPEARSAIHFVFVREKVRADYVESVPDFSTPTVTEEGILLAPAADLVRMKVTSFRLQDKVHLLDMDTVGLITPEIEANLPVLLRDRLMQVRAEAQSTGAE
ncbi:MAG TPA: hypothetical protein VKX49_21940 [Bryobacteraceae bacterium]|nr:hypothetical protein [Bryobacteraceae bacterium]